MQLPLSHQRSGHSLTFHLSDGSLGRDLRDRVSQWIPRVGAAIILQYKEQKLELSTWFKSGVFCGGEYV